MNTQIVFTNGQSCILDWCFICFHFTLQPLRHNNTMHVTASPKYIVMYVLESVGECRGLIMSLSTLKGHVWLLHTLPPGWINYNNLLVNAIYSLELMSLQWKTGWPLTKCVVPVRIHTVNYKERGTRSGACWEIRTNLMHWLRSYSMKRLYWKMWMWELFHIPLNLGNALYSITHVHPVWMICACACVCNRCGLRKLWRMKLMPGLKGTVATLVHSTYISVCYVLSKYKLHAMVILCESHIVVWLSHIADWNVWAMEHMCTVML